MAKIEIVQHGRVRRAKLYYLRELRGKRARIRERRVAPTTTVATEPETAAVEEPEQVEEPAPAVEEAEGAEAAETPEVEEAAEEPEEPTAAEAEGQA